LAELAGIFKALGDTTRLAIFELIRERCGGVGIPQLDTTVSRIAAEFDVSLSTVSHHLKELRNAGLIVCEKRGQSVHCAPNADTLREVERFLGTTA
jgi:ArsR family transcriptional regulator